ncbi:uncharacterized protein LOC135809051 [Sycon ciliatum]|uniref:uncharacterized protein LOC135809051 n=1 Tax=Sycon ciliatum TaxID=27933 RepID=UPI0031F6C4A3
MGSLFSVSALDKGTLDQVHSQLTDKGVDPGTLKECSLIDNDRGGTFYLKYERLETVMRVWDSHCSWWSFEFERQGEREIMAIRLAQQTGVECPEVLISGQVELAGKSRHYMMSRFVSGAREDEWEDKEPPMRFAKVAVSILEKLKSNSNLTPQALVAQGFMKEGERIDQFPLPYLPDHSSVLSYLKSKAKEIGEPSVVDVVKKVEMLFADVPSLPCGPCLVHSDLHPGNLLLDNSFKLLSVVDWEEAAISDIRIDVAQACLACLDRELIWDLFEQETGMNLGDKKPWLALVALMRFMISVQIDWYEKMGKEVPDSNLSGWESLCGDAEEILIELNILPNPEAA